MAKASKGDVAKIQRLIKKHLAARDAGAAKYAEADKLAEEVRRLTKVGQVIPLPPGREAEIIDNFAVKNKVFRQCGVSRIEIKVRDV